MKRSTTWFIMTVAIGSASIGLALNGCGKAPPPPAPTPAPPRPSVTPSNTAAPQSRPTPPPILAPSPTRPSGVKPAGVPATAPTTAPFSIPSANAPATAPIRPDMVPPANDKAATFLGFTGPKPTTWLWHPPQGSMSVAEYAVPGVDGADQAKIVVIPARGTMEANIERWKGQFRTADGVVGAVEPKVESFKVDDMPVTMVEIVGEYKGMGATNYAPDQLFLTAVLAPEYSDDQIFVRFVGPRKTVEANREAFMTMIKGLKRVEAQK